MDAISQLRQQYLDALSRTPTLQKAWPVWQPALREVLSKDGETAGLLSMGKALHDTFRSTGKGDRNQGELSRGGAGWECLICWYLNFLLHGSAVLAMRSNKKFVPEVLRDLLCVTIGNNQTNTESDILVFSIPDPDILERSYPTKGQTRQRKAFDDHLRSRLEKVRVVNLQCKTNWNDNAQIPMLWDNIYNAKTNMANVRVGINGVAPGSLESFRYAFVTVPTVKTEKLGPESLAVLRVANLTGGNYWGLPTKASVAQNIGELVTQQFGEQLVGGLARHHEILQQQCRDYVDNFLTLDWSTAPKNKALESQLKR
jgi:hypothetical protein